MEMAREAGARAQRLAEEAALVEVAGSLSRTPAASGRGGRGRGGRGGRGELQLQLPPGLAHWDAPAHWPHTAPAEVQDHALPSLTPSAAAGCGPSSGEPASSVELSQQIKETCMQITGSAAGGGREEESAGTVDADLDAAEVEVPQVLVGFLIGQNGQNIQMLEKCSKP